MLSRGGCACDAGAVHPNAEPTPVQVLIVDDQASFRHAARGVVELTPGFEVAGEVSSGEASLEAAQAIQPDLVLMDVHMSGMDGLEASRRIRAASSHGGPIVFLLSTYEAVEFAERTLACGAAAYLPKAEFGPERLASAWAAIVGAS